MTWWRPQRACHCEGLAGSVLESIECGRLWSGVNLTRPPPTGSTSPSLSLHLWLPSDQSQRYPAFFRTIIHVLLLGLTRFPAFGRFVEEGITYSWTFKSPRFRQERIVYPSSVRSSESLWCQFSGSLPVLGSLATWIICWRSKIFPMLSRKRASTRFFTDPCLYGPLTLP